MRWFILFLFSLSALADAPTNIDLVVRSLTVYGNGTNVALVISNGSLYLPPFLQPNEGGDGQAGGIYFQSAPGEQGGNKYLINLAHRGQRGQLLLSHGDLALEEDSSGMLRLGNDGASGGHIAISYGEDFARDMPAYSPGWTLPIVFYTRIKAPDSMHVVYSFPGIIGWQGGSTNVMSGQGNLGNSAPGEIHFYSKVPSPVMGGLANDGVQMGAMQTNGWNLAGTLTQQRTRVTIMSTNYFLDFGTNYAIEASIANDVTFTAGNWRPDGIQSASLILRGRGLRRLIHFPSSWRLANDATSGEPLQTNLPAVLLPNTGYFMELKSVGDLVLCGVKYFSDPWPKPAPPQ